VSGYSSWDIYNVLEEHVIEGLQQDAELKSGGSLEVKEWAEEIADLADSVRDDKMPRVACAILTLANQDDGNTSDNEIRRYEGIVEAIDSRGSKATRLQVAKRLAARIERRLSQAFWPSEAAAPDVQARQLQDVTDDLEGGLAGSVSVGLTGTEIDIDNESASLHAVAEIGIAIEITLTIPKDTV